MMKKLIPFLAILAATACGFSRSSNVLEPTAPASGGTSVSTPLMGQWSSQATTTPTPTSCGNFGWAVTAQTSTTLSGNFTAECGGGVTIAGTASGQLASATTVNVTASGTANLPGSPNCAFSLTSVGTILNNGTALEIPYTGTTCLGPVHGTETLRKATPPPPPPPPAPTPTPTPPPSTPGSPDAINLNQVIVFNSPADIASWPVTSTITSLTMSPSAGLSFEFTTKNSWPDYLPPGWDGPLQYTVWPVVKINGQWYSSGIIQMWRGRASTGAPILTDFASNWVYDARWGTMMGYQPRVGEQMGFFLSAGDARGNGAVTSVRERTNVILVTLPPGDSGSFSSGALRLFGTR